MQLQAWLLQEGGDGVELVGELSRFDLALETDRRYVISFTSADHLREDLLIDTELPSQAMLAVAEFNASVVLEPLAGKTFNYAGPTALIHYRADLGRGAYDENAPLPPSQEVIRNLERLQASGDPQQRSVRPIRLRTGRIWLDPWSQPCERRNAAFYLQADGMENGLFSGSIRSLDGNLMARGHFADPDLSVRHGGFTFLYANGSTESEGQYALGLKTGLWRRFDEQGHELAEKVYDPRPLAELVAGNASGSIQQQWSSGSLMRGHRAATVGEAGPGITRTRQPSLMGETGEVVLVAMPDASKPITEDRSTCTSSMREDEPGGVEMNINVERLRVITVIRADKGGRSSEFRRVATFHGPVYYFKDGRSCTSVEYEQGLAELNDGTPP